MLIPCVKDLSRQERPERISFDMGEDLRSIIEAACNGGSLMEFPLRA